jgi:hypothetical protein
LRSSPIVSSETQTTQDVPFYYKHRKAWFPFRFFSPPIAVWGPERRCAQNNRPLEHPAHEEPQGLRAFLAEASHTRDSPTNVPADGHRRAIVRLTIQSLPFIAAKRLESKRFRAEVRVRSGGGGYLNFESVSSL